MVRLITPIQQIQEHLDFLLRYILQYMQGRGNFARAIYSIYEVTIHRAPLIKQF
jgi:hypothetical protein